MFRQLSSYLPLILLSFVVPADAGTNSLCAEVKIAIKQELTLERQAFDAHMRINNGLTDTSLETVKVEVIFEDEAGNEISASNDPDDTDAAFFIREDSGGISGYSDGQWNIEPVDPESSSDLHWLIIPAPGSADGKADGKVYYVGAVLTYSLGGEENKIEVTPDYIFVKPLPELELDYFLEENVYGDDAWTDVIESPVPFTLGVRVKNFGNNTAENLKIESAQPEIVDNKQGLAIDFEIAACYVNGVLSDNTLLARFGDIEPETAGVARWLMTCTLSGTFTDFDAVVTHSDELGGELTSLLKQENLHTHLLVKDVLVDIAGRDDIHDFLAEYGDILRVYESECVDTDVTDLSSQSAIEYIGTSNDRAVCQVETPPCDSFLYIKLADPMDGNMNLSSATRNDGKQIPEANAWLSRERKENPEDGWYYYVNMFDVNTTGAYELVFEDAGTTSHAPVIQAILDKTCVEGERVSFTVEATDQDGTVPALTLSGTPAGAGFTDQGDGTGVFDWQTQEGQAGEYTLVFTASDGGLEDEETVKITVAPKEDTDIDGMTDDWEMEHFGTTDRNGAGDWDGDGIMDYYEYLLNTDPINPSTAPTVPEIRSPLENAHVAVENPVIVVENSTDEDGDTLFYDFEIYSDDHFTEMVASGEQITEGTDTTAFQIPVSLEENRSYYFRVRSTDKTAHSFWAYGKFFVNTANDPPGGLYVSFPETNTQTDTCNPVLEVISSPDPENDLLTCTFSVYSDEEMTALVTRSPDIPVPENGRTTWQIDVALIDGMTYYWRAEITDANGATAETGKRTSSAAKGLKADKTPGRTGKENLAAAPSATTLYTARDTGAASFDVNTSNHAPTLSAISMLATESEITVTRTDLTVENGRDEDGDSLTYCFELDTTDRFCSSSATSSGEVSEGTGTTSFHVESLEDNTWYFCRARASDGKAVSQWVYGSFFVNTGNDTPSTPVIKNPAQGSWSGTLTPDISVCPSTDADEQGPGSALTYFFELYDDADLANLVQQKETTDPAFTPSPALENNTIYYFRVLAVDEHSATSGWSDATLFFVKETGEDQPPENHDPVISGTPATSVNEDALYAFVPEASDADTDDTLAFSITNQPAWADFSTETGELSGTPENEDVATYEGIIITVSDASGGTDSLAPFDITVHNVNDAPQINGTPDTSVKEGAFYTFTPTATDVDEGDTLTFSILNTPAFADFDTDTGELSGTPGNTDVGVYEDIIISVTDSAGTTASLDGFTLTVIDVNAAPVAVGDNYCPPENETFTVPAPGVLDNDTDEDEGAALTAELVTGVSHGVLSLNSDGGFTYTPDTGFSGTDRFTYRANDGLAESGEAEVTLTVSDTDDPPVISPVPDQTITENTAITGLALDIEDPDTATEDLSVTACSDNQTLIPDAGITVRDRTLTIVPAEGEHGTATISVTVTDDTGNSAGAAFEVEVTSKSSPAHVRYYFLNPESLNYPVHIVSLESGNEITTGDLTFTLDRYESREITCQEMSEAGISQGDAVSGTAFYSLGQEGAGTHMLVPESFAGTQFVIPHIRYTHYFFIFSPYGTAAVHIQNSALEETVTVDKGEVTTFDAGETNPDASLVTSDLPVLVSHMALRNNIPYDVYPVPPASTDIFGLLSGQTTVAALQDYTSVTVYADNGTTQSFQVSTDQPRDIEPGGTNEEPGCALYVTADKPVAAVQADAPNGTTASPFLDPSYFGTCYGIPVEAKNVIVITTDSNLMLGLFSSSKWPVIEPLAGASGSCPGKFVLSGDALTDLKADLSGGNHIITSKPVYILYDTCNQEERHNVLGKLTSEN